MDNVILDVVLGLVLMYALLALLVTSLQEMVTGWALKTRVDVMHDLVREATGRDDDLRQRVLRNPLVFALYESDDAKKRGWWISSGPADIPPDLFTRALLAEIDPTGGGTPPTERHATPQAFVDALVAAGLDQHGKGPYRAVRALRALLPGRETSWGDYEAAVAAWYTHIGDRAKGWFKRDATRWTFFISLLLSALLNLDSLHIASALAGDPDVRDGVARLAERVSAERESGKSTAATPTTTTAAEPLKAETRVSARLTDAYNRLRPLYFRDNEIAAFVHRLGSVSQACATVTTVDPASPTEGRLGKLRSGFISDAPSWIDVLPVLQTQIDLLVAGSQDLVPLPTPATSPPGERPSAPGGQQGSQPTRASGSSPAAAPTACPVPAASSASAGTSPHANPASGTASSPATECPAPAQPPKPPDEDPTTQKLRSVHACLTHVSAWVRAATTASKQPDAQKAMQDASVALEESKSALLELVGRRGVPVSIRKLFQSSPEAFNDCAAESTTLEGLRRCVESRLPATARLPIGWSDYNRMSQFCEVATAKRGQAFDPNAGRNAGVMDLCEPALSSVSPAVFTGSPRLGLDPMALNLGSHWRYLFWLAGILITTIFAMLGAPFWFDLLAKVTKIRVAGRRSDEAADAAKGAGTLPLLPLPAPPGTSIAAPPSGPTQPGDPRVASGEVELTRREIIALQQRLDVIPATGEMDAPTRLKLKAALERAGLGSTDRITAASYLALVGRAAIGGEPLVVGTLAKPVLRRPYAATQALARQLGNRLGLQAEVAQLVPSTEGLFSDDLRALAVLYRYKTGTPTDHAAPVFKLATDNPAALNEIDTLLLNELLTPLPANFNAPARHAAPWLEWAIGELGQVEVGADHPKASNPRIVEYLETMQPGGKRGDKTPWCGAFVAWVVKRHNKLVQPGQAALTDPPADADRAASWADWAAPSTGDTPTPGDVVVVNTKQSASGFHVGFCFEVDAHTVYLLGGNQSGGSRVSLTAFPLSSVHASRR